MIPPSTPVIQSRLTEPDSYGIVGNQDFERGAAVDAPNKAIRDQVWRGELRQGSFLLKPPDRDWYEFLPLPGVTKTPSFSFDSAMQPALAYELGGVSYLYWYDATLSRYDLLSFAGVSSPFLGHTYPPDTSFTIAGLVLAYVRAGRVYCRFQSSRFLDEVDYGPLPSGRSRITGVGLGTNWRLHIRLGR